MTTQTEVASVTTETTAKAAVLKAASLLGGQKQLGDRIGASQSEVSQWVTGRRPVPPKKAAAIERVTAGEVTRQQLRPGDWQQLWPELRAA